MWPILLAAFAGFALGSLQSLLLDWARARSQHRRQLRQWRSELRRLSEYRQLFGWNSDTGPSSDIVPNPPRITASYLRLLEATDFWLTDAHSDDNTQQALIEIADGVDLLGHYASETHRFVDSMHGAAHDIKADLRERALETSQAYDKEHDRWRIMIESALLDIERRLRVANLLTQAGRLFRPMPKGENPPPLPPVSDG